jgi:CubicO group peptidase (beta-lactamase class C family)
MKTVSLVLVLACAATPAQAADPWAQLGVGLTQKPSWLDSGVDRRLWLLEKMPDAQSKVQSDAANAFPAKGGPSMAMGLVLDDGLYFSYAVGYRDANQHDADENTFYRTGSLSKVFTGTALLTMIDNPHGRKNPTTQTMTLDDDASTYVPELKQVCPAPLGQTCTRGKSKLGITLRHLVSHTAGLANVIQSNSNNGLTDVQTFLTKYLPNTWVFYNQPGKVEAYSGDGTAVVGILLGRMSLEGAYAKYVVAHLLEPLGMKLSTFDHTTVPADQLALKYTYNAKPTPTFTAVTSWDDVPNNVLTPTGGLISSVWEQARWQKMWISGKAPKDSQGHEILAATTLANAAQPAMASVPGISLLLGLCSLNTSSNGVFSYFSPCGSNQTFGVNWGVNPPSSINYHGADQWFESHSIINLNTSSTPGMGAIGLISVDRGGLPGFVSDLFNIGQQADADGEKSTSAGKQSWNNVPLAIGVARLLWILGAQPPAGAGTPKLINTPAKGAPPPVAPAGSTIVADGIKTYEETKTLFNFQSQLMAQLSTANKLTPMTVQPFVTKLLNGESGCSTFRVRGATPHTAHLRIKCGSSALDAKLQITTTAPYLIDSITITPAAAAY